MQKITLQGFISLGSIYLVFLGSLRLGLYYSAFRINVFSYLDFTEIITSFLDIAIILAFISTLVIFISIPSELERSNKGSKSLIEEYKSLNKGILKWFFKSFPVLSIMLIGWTVFGIQSLFYNISQGILIILITVLILSCLGLLAILEIQKGKHSISVFLLFRASLMVFFSCSIVAILTFINVIDLKSNGYSKGVEVWVDNNEKLISDESNYFVGKTRNYIFFYHAKEKTCEVIPMEKVVRLKMK